MKTYFGIQVKEDGLRKYICLKDIPEKYRANFLKWMNYETGLNQSYGCPDFKGVFVNDFEAWVKDLKNQISREHMNNKFDMALNDDYASIKFESGAFAYYGYEETVGFGLNEEWAFIYEYEGKRTTISSSELIEIFPNLAHESDNTVAFLTAGLALMMTKYQTGRPMTTHDNVQVYTHDLAGFLYVCSEDIPESYANEFNKWMYGQTVSEGPMCKSGAAIYLEDFNRFWRMKFENKPTYFD